MNEKLRILIEAGINEALSVDRINSDLIKLQSKIKNLKIGLDVDSQNLNQVTESIGNITKASQQASKTSPISKETVSNTKGFYTSLQHAVSEYSKLGKIDVTSTSLNPITKEVEGFSIAVTNAENKIEKLKFELSKDVLDGSGRLFQVSSHQEIDQITKKSKEAARLANQMADGRIKAQEKFMKLEEATQKNRMKIVHYLANAENKRFNERKRFEKEYNDFWQKALRTREEEEAKVAQRTKEKRIKYEQEVNERWQKNLHARDQREKQDDLKRIHDVDRAHAMAFREMTRREKELGVHSGQIHDKKTAHYLAEREHRKRIEVQQKKEIALEKQNIALRERIILQIRRMENDPVNRKRLNHLREYRNELNRLNMTATSTADRMKRIQHSVREVGVEMQGMALKTSTFMGAFQNALINYCHLVR